MKRYIITENQVRDLTLCLNGIVDAMGINKAKIITSACLILDGIEEMKEENEEED